MLRHLQTDESYEPLEEATFRNLTKKTLFLVSLATAKRVSELQGLANMVGFTNSKAYVQYLPEFIPKTSILDNPTPRDFKIKAISRAHNNQPDDLRLCPVRALRICLNKVKSQPLCCRNLFVQLNHMDRPMSKNGISYFLRDTIREAHQLQPDADYPIGDVSAHSIRAVATSLNFMKNRSISAVMEAATWRGNNTFTSFYLRDVGRVYEHCRALGPIVVGSTVL